MVTFKEKTNNQVYSIYVSYGTFHSYIQEATEEVNGSDCPSCWRWRLSHNYLKQIILDDILSSASTNLDLHTTIYT